MFWQRILNLWEMLTDFAFEKAEGSFSEQRRLDKDLQRRRKRRFRMYNKSVDVGQKAKLMTLELAKLRASSANIRADILRHTRLAQQAQLAGDLHTEQAEKAEAAALADDYALAEADLQQTEEFVEQAFANFDIAKRMIKEESRRIAQQARNNMRLIMKSDMTSMVEEINNSLREMAGLTSDGSEYSAYADISRKTEERAARAEADSEVLHEILGDSYTGMNVVTHATSARGAEVLAEIMSEVGYTEPQAVPQPVAEESQAQVQEGEAQ